MKSQWCARQTSSSESRDSLCRNPKISIATNTCSLYRSSDRFFIQKERRMAKREITSNLELPWNASSLPYLFISLLYSSHRKIHKCPSVFLQSVWVEREGTRFYVASSVSINCTRCSASLASSMSPLSRNFWLSSFSASILLRSKEAYAS